MCVVVEGLVVVSGSSGSWTGEKVSRKGRDVWWQQKQQKQQPWQWQYSVSGSSGSGSGSGGAV